MPHAEPNAPLGHLARLGFALVGAHDVDDVARALFADLTALPGVTRVGFALSEGGGRRLRFTASERDHSAGVSWCHIDAYDDVPLTTVMRTGDPLLIPRATMDRNFPEYGAAQPAELVALAAVPLPGVGSPIGGIVLSISEPWTFTEAQRRLLDATARRTAEAVRRVRVTTEPQPDVVSPDDEGTTSSARMTLEDDPRSAGAARRFLREFLLARDDVPDEVSATAQLCLSELVTNALVHATGRCELRATLAEGVLTVSVRDRGAASPRAEAVLDPDADPLRVHGRGLQLVEALSDRWGSERDAGGSTVWFALALDGHQARASETG